MLKKVSLRSIQLINFEEANHNRKDSEASEPDSNIFEEKPLIKQPKKSIISLLIRFYNNNVISCINKLLSISLHIFIMIYFEIYFYFNYVIYLEKEEFMKKIKQYIKNLDTVELSTSESLIIKESLLGDEKEVSNRLYNQYKNSISIQTKEIHKLLTESYKILTIVGLITGFFLLGALCYRKEIKWKVIVLENILMFGFLGIFEYYFFRNVILKFNPVSDAELEYTIYEGIIKRFNETRY